MEICGLMESLQASLRSEHNLKSPGSAGFRGEPGLDPGSPQFEWWGLKSEANPSPTFSLFNREKTRIFGNIILN